MNFKILLIIHAILGVLFAVVGPSPIFSYAIVVIGVVHISTTANRNNQAAFWAVYWAGLEVLLRMTGSNIVWEAGKYGVILFLITGMLSEQKMIRFNPAILIFFALLLPSVFVSSFSNFLEARTVLAFNLSGPLTLVVSSIYFSHRKLKSADLVSLLRFLLLPIISTAVYLFIATPSVSEIDFYSESNIEASGGFGPNQVATILGFGLLVLFYNLYYRKPISGSLVIDFLLLFLIGFRGLVTFSRGGIIVAVICIALTILFEMVVKKSRSGNLLVAISIGVLIFAVWDFANKTTAGMLENRYKGYNPYQDRYEEVSSGRMVLLMNELQWFVDNPILGIGPGMARFQNKEDIGVLVTTHSEFTRLLGEHGSLGLIALIILLSVQFRNFNKKNKKVQPIIISLIAFIFLTMFHSAMRLAFPGLLFGVVLSNIQIPEKYNLHRKQSSLKGIHANRS